MRWHSFWRSIRGSSIVLGPGRTARPQEFEYNAATATYLIAEFDTISGAAAGEVSNLFTVTGDFLSVPTVSLNLNPTGVEYITVSSMPTLQPVSIGLLAVVGLRPARG